MKKFKTYAFWVALSGAIVILIQSLGKLFGFEIESSTVENVIMSICGVLVVLGIVTKTNDANAKDNYSDSLSTKDEAEKTQESCSDENNTIQ